MLKYLYILLFSLLLPGTLLAQKFVYDVNFKTKQPDNYPLVSCSVKLYDNKANHLIESKNTDAEGSANFKLELKQGLEYRVEFVKEGYSAYKMLIDSKIPDIEKLAKAEYSRKFVIKMEKGNQSASSVGVLRKIKYLSNARDFDDDPSFVPNSDKKKFDQLMVEGEKLLAAKKLDKAKDMFLNALDIYPEDRDALQKIASINAELAKSDNEKQRSLKAMETLNLAKGLLKQNKLPEARMKFQEVLAIDPTNKEAQQQVAEIDKKIGTTAKANTNEQQYKELIDKGDKNTAAENYLEAITNYTEALKIKPNDKNVTSKLDKATKLLKQNQEKLYTKSINKGDEALKSKDYEIAKLEYEKALAIKPSEKYPKTKLDEVNKVLNEMAKTLNEINTLTKDRNATAELDYMRDQIIKQEKLKAIKREQELIQLQMKNLTTKYETENPITKLYNAVDKVEKSKQ